jgi:hypothetical protein
MPRSNAISLLLLFLSAGTAAAQSTIPHWSTYFGGTQREEAVVVRRGPGNLVTLVGDTRSTGLVGQGGLATPGAFQTANAGLDDVFIARFDPSLPAGTQLLWCTYLGGTGIEFALDAEVDPVTGVTTVVGLTASPTFPGPGQPLPVSGPSDGFVAQIDAAGTTLPFSMLYGGAGDDNICDLEVDSAGLFTISGVTASTNLPNPTNAYRGGANDAFVARFAPVGPGVVLWSTYLGGNSTEGWTYTTFITNPGSYQGNLDRMGLTLDAGGNAVVATVSFQGTALPELSNPGCAPQPYQSTYGGNADVYLATLTAGGSVCYGTLFGGADYERPKAIALHPEGGFVVVGVTQSTNMPTTPGCVQSVLQTTVPPTSDGFLAWIDPAPTTGLRYGTYFGGNAGEETIFAVAVETSGVITVGGHSRGGNLPITPRCLQGFSGPAQTFGFVARLDPVVANRALFYSSFVGPVAAGTNTVVRSVVLDELGDVWLAGATDIPSVPVPYHLQNPFQATNNGGREALLTHLPLLPGGVARDMVPFGTHACPAPRVPLYIGMANAPIENNWFGITATNAPPLSMGVLVIGAPLPAPVPVFNGWLLANLDMLFVWISNSQGYARSIDFWLPPGPPAPTNWGLAAQWWFFTNPACPGSGLFGNSERLRF